MRFTATGIAVTSQLWKDSSTSIKFTIPTLDCSIGCTFRATTPPSGSTVCLPLGAVFAVYSRFFKLYLATAIAPIPIASFAGQPSSSIGVAFLKSYAAICLEGCIKMSDRLIRELMGLG